MLFGNFILLVGTLKDANFMYLGKEIGRGRAVLKSFCHLGMLDRLNWCEISHSH